MLFSTQIDGAKANWGYSGLHLFKTWKNNYVNIFKPGERPKKPSRSATSNEQTYDVRVNRWRTKLEKYEERYHTFAQKKQKAYANLAETQAWLYDQVVSSFSETDVTSIKRYEPSISVDELLKEDPMLGFTDFRQSSPPLSPMTMQLCSFHTEMSTSCS